MSWITKGDIVVYLFGTGKCQEYMSESKTYRKREERVILEQNGHCTP
jgi:hypothetical protein